MLYGKITAVCSAILTEHLKTEHINTLCGLNAGCIWLSLVVHIVTTGLRRFSQLISWQWRPTGTHQLVDAVGADDADEDCACYTQDIARSQEGVRHGQDPRSQAALQQVQQGLQIAAATTFTGSTSESS